MIIRRYEQKDAKDVIELAKRFNGVSYMRYRDQAKMEAKQRDLALKAVKENTENIFVAEDQGELFGYIELTIQEDYFTKKRQAYVSAISVASQGEGKGIGKALMKKAEEWALSHGLTEVILDVFKNNERAVGLYEHLGYQQEVVKMVKEL